MSGRRRAAIGLALRLFPGAIALTLGFNTCDAQVLSPDTFGTERRLPDYGTAGIGIQGGCDGRADASGQLSLRDALDMGLCTDPKLGAAWRDVKVKAAELGQAQGAYLPTITGNYQAIQDHSQTDVQDHPNLSSSNHSLIQTVDVSANLILWDFGSRAAATRAARELLMAAQSTWQATLQTEYARIAKDYFTAVGAAGTAHAAKDALDSARKTVEAARARVTNGIAPVSDELQAQTSLEEAAYESQKADSDFRAAAGILSIDIGRDPMRPLNLPDIHDMSVDEQAIGLVRDLLATVDSGDPTIAAAVAQVNAAQAQLEKVRADGLPAVSFVSKYTRNNQPASLGLGIPQFPATGHDWYVGVQVRIPIFEGFVRNYQIREARAKVEEAQQNVLDARRQASSGVWSDYETVVGSGANANSTKRLVAVAQQSFDVATRRYQVGAGSILEVLSAQATLARADRQRVQALASYGTSTSQLAARLGQVYAR